MLLVVSSGPASAQPAARAKRLAVLEFAGGDLSAKGLEYVTDRVRGEALKYHPRPGWVVMTRESMLVLISANRGECLKEGECEVETGRNIGADLVVVGKVVRLGSKVRLTMASYDTHSGALLRTAEVAAGDVDGLVEGLPQGCRDLLASARPRPFPPRPGASAGRSIGEAAPGAWELPVAPEHAVAFDTTPPGAAVYLDDQYLCDTPCRRDLAEGRHAMVLKLPRHEPVDEPLEVKAGVAVRRDLVPVFGWITVRSEPSGLQVVIDGQPAGVTPVGRHEALPGRHTVLVTDPRRYDAGEEVLVSRAQERVVSVALAPREGGLQVRAVDAQGDVAAVPVLVDEVEVGRTPWAGKVLVGGHKVSTAGGPSQRVEVREREMAEVVFEAGAAGAMAPRSATGIELVRIPAGEFVMGSPNAELNRDSDEGRHRVRITRPFLLARTEVTQAQWRTVMGENPSKFGACGDNCPVENVSWSDAVLFLNRLSDREGLRPCYRIWGGDPSWDRTCVGYRLPTEAEWEYAARAGTTTAYHAGDGEDALGRAGWYIENPGGTTHPVGGKEANAWGLFDVHGNVWEWVWDRYGSYEGDATDPIGPRSGAYRVARGGSWGNTARNCRAAARGRSGPGFRNINLGFRPSIPCRALHSAAAKRRAAQAGEAEPPAQAARSAAEAPPGGPGVLLLVVARRGSRSPQRREAQGVHATPGSAHRGLRRLGAPRLPRGPGGLNRLGRPDRGTGSACRRRCLPSRSTSGGRRTPQQPRQAGQFISYEPYHIGKG